MCEEDWGIDESWVRLRNTGPTALDLSGWKLRGNGSTGHFRFPSDTNLAAGATLRVVSRDITPGPGELQAPELRWYDRGEQTARLHQPDGRTASEFTYTGKDGGRTARCS